MNLITKESAFKIFYYIIAADGMITDEETEKLNEIGLQLFGDGYPVVQNTLMTDCEAKTIGIFDDPDESFDILSDCIEEALNNTTKEADDGIPSRLLIWNLLLIAHSDGDFARNEQRFINKINRKMNLGDSVLFEMEQYINTVQVLENELDKLKDSMEPYKTVRPVVDELEKRLMTIKTAALSLIEDEVLNSVEKLTIQDDVIDKAQSIIKAKTDPMMKKVNEQKEKMFDDVKKAAAPAAAEAGKKIGKAFMGFGSKLMKHNQSDTDGKE